MRVPVSGLVLSVVFLSACANHVQFVDKDSERTTQSVTATNYGIDAPEGVLQAPRLRVSFFKDETVQTVTERTTVRIEEYTPYSGARELFEVPAGLVSVPASFTLNLFDCLLFGYIPNEIVNGYTFWTFAALNPTLNAESSARLEKREISTDTQEKSRESKVVRHALGGRPIELTLDDRPAQTVPTTPQGVLAIDLLPLAAGELPYPPRRLGIVLRDAATGEEHVRHAYYLDRDLSARLYRAAPLLGALAFDSASPDDLSRAVYALDRLGFREASAKLHDDVYARRGQSVEFIDRFRSLLDDHYAHNTELFQTAPAAPSGAPAVQTPD
jgi:hypothetical protein